MLFSDNWEKENDDERAKWIEREIEWLRSDAPLHGANWRDFEAEATENWEKKNNEI